MTGRYCTKRIDDMDSTFHGCVRLAGAELGLRALGMQVLDFPAGFTDYPEHDHAEDGQEEVYVVLDGSAEFTVDGDTLALGSGEMLRVDAPGRRSLRPGPAGVRILAIGAVPDGAYVRPEAFRTGARA